MVVIENEAQPGRILPDPLPPNTRRIELPDNEGTTGSINRAVTATESRYILLLNNDVELRPDYIEKLVRALDADPKLGFATGKLLRATQRTHLDGAGDAMLMAGAAYRLGHFDRDDGQFDRPTPILGGCGAAVLYRREVFERCGRLDVDFFAYLDDLDLALRAHLLGYTGVYLPDAVAYHIGSATLGEVLHPRVVEYVTRNQIYLLLKDYPRAVFGGCCRESSSISACGRCLRFATADSAPICADGGPDSGDRRKCDASTATLWRSGASAMTSFWRCCGIPSGRFTTGNNRDHQRTARAY